MNWIDSIDSISQKNPWTKITGDDLTMIKRWLTMKTMVDVAGMELQWKDLNTVIDRSLADGKLRLDQLHTYEKLRDQVLEWLTKNENRVDSLQPVAVDADILKKQTDEMKVKIPP